MSNLFHIKCDAIKKADHLASLFVMRIHRLLFLWSVFFVCMCFCGKRSFRWINVTCTNNPDIVLVDCEIAKFENRTVVNFWGSIVKDIEDVHSYMSVDIIRSKQDNIRIIETYYDGCKFLKSAPHDMVAVVAFKLIEQFGRFPKMCPVKAPNNYSMENVFLDAVYLPAYTPEALFMAVVKFSTKRVEFFETTIYGKVEILKSQRTDLPSGRRS